MTEIMYLPDSDGVTEFEAEVTRYSEDSIVLDRTYFYPEGGGQPPDHGVIEWGGGRAEIDDVYKDHGDVVHSVGAMEGDPPEEGTTVEARLDEERRNKLRRMHTAQHVVSKVVLDGYGAETAGNQIHLDRSRIDFEPVEFDGEDLEEIERRANAVIEKDLGVTKENRPRERVEREVEEGRALLDLIPDHVDPLRIVEIDGFGTCPCGGTHVDSLSEIGEIEITNRESKGEDTDRITFVLEDDRRVN